MWSAFQRNFMYKRGFCDPIILPEINFISISQTLANTFFLKGIYGPEYTSTHRRIIGFSYL